LPQQGYRNVTSGKKSLTAERSLPAPEQFIVSRKRRTARSLCFGAIPKGKRHALFPGKPFYTFPGIAQQQRWLMPSAHMAPIQIAMEMRKVLMQTSETTS
jgi:hypothetical protein